MKKVLFAIVAIVAAFALNAPAKAGMFNATDTIVSETGTIGPQVASAVAGAQSRTNEAVASATGANLVNTADLTANTTGLNAQIGNSAGGVASEVNTQVGQVAVETSQTAGATTNAVSRTSVAEATSLAANIGNSVSQAVNNNLTSTRH